MYKRKQVRNFINDPNLELEDEDLVKDFAYLITMFKEMNLRIASAYISNINQIYVLLTVILLHYKSILTILNIDLSRIKKDIIILTVEGFNDCRFIEIKMTGSDIKICNETYMPKINIIFMDNNEKEIFTLCFYSDINSYDYFLRDLPKFKNYTMNNDQYQDMIDFYHYKPSDCEYQVIEKFDPYFNIRITHSLIPEDEIYSNKKYVEFIDILYNISRVSYLCNRITDYRYKDIPKFNN